METDLICGLELFKGELTVAIDEVGLESFNDWLKQNEKYNLRKIFNFEFVKYCYENLIKEENIDETCLTFVRTFMPYFLFFSYKKNQNAILSANFTTDVNSGINQINVYHELVNLYNKGVDLLAQNLTSLSVDARLKITKINIQKINIYGI